MPAQTRTTSEVMKLQDLIPLLEQAGWKRFRNEMKKADACLAKGFPSHEECRSNQGKGKQVEVYLYEWEARQPSCMIELCGDIGEDEWIHLNRYGVTKPSLEKIEAIAKSLLELWDIAVKKHNE